MIDGRLEAMAARMARRDEVSGAERARIDEVRSLGFVPDDVGPEIIMAPARGPIRMFEVMASYPKGADGFDVKPAGFMGRKALRRADSFDIMAAKAARHKKPSPFTPAQVATGRQFRDLVERHACAGIKCSSLESVSRGGGGGGGEYMDAVLRDRETIELMRNRIGSGAAMIVRRRRQSKPDARVSIFDRRLVEIICLEDLTMTDVLRRHGWSIKAGLIASLQARLGEVLDRMRDG